MLFYWFVFSMILKNIFPFDIACGGNHCYSETESCVFKFTSGINLTTYYNNSGYFCNCSSRYASYPSDNTYKCTYKLFSQKTAFLLELLVSFGAGNFYIQNFQITIPKLLFWLVGYILFIILRMVTKKQEENNTTALLVARNDADHSEYFKLLRPILGI